MADLSVYIDFKSPYAYLAIEPTRRLAAELQIEVDWFPFVLDIPSYLGSARLDKAGKVMQHSRSEDQWSGVKYAYYDCRRYANLRCLTIRGTEKIWDTNLASIGMLWAKRQGSAVLDAYMDAVYLPFWKRELDVEDIAVIESVLAEAGAMTRGFSQYAAVEGKQENEVLQTESFERGIFGVPTYIVGEEIFFGREHLPRIRWHLTGEVGPAPDVGNPLFGDDALPATDTRRLDVGVDLADFESLAAIDAIKLLGEECDVEINWYPISVRVPTPADADAGQGRGARHRTYRSENHRRNEVRYALPDKPSAEALGIQWSDEVEAPDWAGAGTLGGPTFRLGSQVFAGRQHLPLIRAMLRL